MSKIIGICGGSASGKTTICNDVASRFPEDIQIISQDSYYLDRSSLSSDELSKVNFDSPESVDLEQLEKDLSDLKAGNRVSIPQYCFETHSRLEEKIDMGKSTIILVEGLFIFESERLREKIDYKIFVEADDDIRLARRIKRDIQERGRGVDSVLEQYLTMVKPMHDLHIANKGGYADYVVNTSDSFDLEPVRDLIESFFDDEGRYGDR